MDIALNSYSLRAEWKDFGRDKTDVLIEFCKDNGFTKVELLDSEFTAETLPGKSIKDVPKNPLIP